MNKKQAMCVIIFLLMAGFGISKFYIWLCSDGIREAASVNRMAEPEKKAPVSVNKITPVTIDCASEETTLSESQPKTNQMPMVETRPEFPAYSDEKPVAVSRPKSSPLLMTETRPDYVNDLRLAVETGNEFDVQTAMESAAGCETCISEMINILDDPSYDKTFRKHIAGSLMKSGNPEGVASVVKSIVSAHKDEDDDFKDDLMQILANSDSPETANSLADILAGNSERQEMPEDVVYAIKKAIRLIPDETVGESLAQKYFDASSEDEKKALFEINHPVMIAQIAADALRQGDYETADRLMEEIAGDESGLGIRGIMLLARDRSIPPDTVSNMLSFWSFSNADNNLAHSALVEYLANAEFSPEERSLAAHAMASEKDKEMAKTALKKAQQFEEDPLVQEYIEDALSRIAGDG